jgi:hypothetical protein
MRRRFTPRSETMTFVEVSQNYGAIAQLGERLNGIQEVRGSIPRSSTINEIIVIIQECSLLD